MIGCYASPVQGGASAMCDRLKERKQAMLMYHVQHLSKSEICRRFKRPRSWLDRWLERYDPGDVEQSLQDCKAGPKQASGSWSEEIRQQVLQMRKDRVQQEQWRYAFIGAEAIHLELKALGSPEVPPVRTIHTWFVKEDLVQQPDKPAEKRKPKPIPLPPADQVNRVQQLDLKGPVYLSGGNPKYYVIVLRDRFSHRCALDVFDNREARSIVEFLVTSWRWMGLPDYLQLDNALEFRGSNRYPRSFGRVVRVAVSLSVEPIFNPPREPWRNGGVEHFNGFVSDRLLKVVFTDVNAFRSEAWVCQDACNQTHRLPACDGLTPNEIAAQARLRFPPEGYQRHQDRQLPQDQGFVSFVRLVRKSGRITLGAGDRFMVDPELAYQYVLARVDLAQKVVRISHDDQVVKTYDFSPETVGAWAEDASQEQELAHDEVVKEQCNV
jgi:putative transposase